MNQLIKPTRVLCKRTETSGDSYWWDDEATPPVRHERDNRMFVAGQWYDVVDNPNDSWDEEKRSFTFSVIDNQGNIHLHCMYGEEDKAGWPDICTKYGPRDYAKWFYTPEELEQLNKGEFKLEEDINIRAGNCYWVKFPNYWTIGVCINKNATKNTLWKIIGSENILKDSELEAIGQQIVSQEKQLESEEKTDAYKKVFDEACALIDAFDKNDPDGNYPSIEYVMPFVKKAVENYFEVSSKYLAAFFDKAHSKTKNNTGNIEL